MIHHSPSSSYVIYCHRNRRRYRIHRRRRSHLRPRGPEIPNIHHQVLASIPEYRAIAPPFYRALQSNLRRRRHIIRSPYYGPSRRGHENHRLVLVYRLAGPELRRNERIRGCPHREEILATWRRLVFQGYQRVSLNLIYGIHARGGSGRGCFFFNITSNLYISGFRRVIILDDLRY